MMMLVHVKLSSLEIPFSSYIYSMRMDLPEDLAGSPFEKGFALSLDSSSGMEIYSTFGSGSSQDKVQDKRQHIERELYQRSICGLMESYHGLHPTPSRVSATVSAHVYQISLQKKYNFGGGLLRYKFNIKRFMKFCQYTWVSELNEEVKEGWLKVFGKNLRNLVDKVGKQPDDKLIRSDPKLQKKSAQCLKNRIEGPNAETLRYQGSISTSQLARRMEGKTPTPSTLFARSQSKEDPNSGKVLIDNRSQALWVRLSGMLKRGRKRQRSYTIYGLRTSATLFYDKPTASTISASSTYIPSAYSKLQAQLDEQKKLVDDQGWQFDKALKLIHSLQS
ncbi:hypothetical protein Cgig2_013925 [Carnegiea gigantea]|uniref:Uncharacterized protein n=1 Tax=Carnegiea gigantea TaxID=171969 RepID=A0A9Q1K2F7_9CARY|nr:hypothetical protein Cgig2_013925 [Carnegiea gigantea]